MFFNLLNPYSGQYHGANLLTYISTRSGLAFLVSFLACLYLTPKLIEYLNSRQRAQPIREDGPASHFKKAGTPTMGGLCIIAASTLATLLFADLANVYIWLVLLVFLSFGGLGFVDDYTKVSQNNYRGISARAKIAMQISASMLASIGIFLSAKGGAAGLLALPFFKNLMLDFGYFYLVFMVFVIIGSSNAVNLTDGLDGLAIGTTAIAFTAFGLITYLVGNAIYAKYLQVIFVPGSGELTIFCASIFGASLAFLWYNCKPAEIFMGDTGSLALGGALGTISVITKHEIVLAIIGGVFVMETFSVIIQVYYFKLTKGKRFFLMAPIHHHFEKKGWPESKVVTRFWILAIIFALLGVLTSLKVR